MFTKMTSFGINIKIGTPSHIDNILPYHPGVRIAISLYHYQQLTYKAKEKIKAYELFTIDRLPAERIASVLTVSRSTVYRWIKEVIIAKKLRRYQLLNPKSKRPKRIHRIKKINREIAEKILQIREEYKCGKDKISIYLKLLYNIKISPTTIHRFLTNLPKDKDPLYKDRVLRRRKKRKKYTPKVRYKHIKSMLKGEPFELIQIDTKYFNSLGARYYIISAIDVSTRYSFVYAYTSHSSLRAKDFLQRLEIAFRLKELRKDKPVFINCDNGGEFMKYFKDYAQKIYDCKYSS